jgi:hypothetical protein
MSLWRLVLLTVGLVVALGLPVVASAGGWLVMTLDALPAGDTRAGEELSIGFMVRQHGQQPIAGVGPVLTFVHRESGQRVSIKAADEGATGHYVARFTPDRAGAWEWSIFAWEMRHAMPPLTVAPAAATATVPATPVVEPVAARWPLLAGSGAMMLLAGAFLVLAWRGGGPVMATPRPEQGQA